MIRRHIRILRALLMASDALVAAVVLVAWYGLRFAVPGSRDSSALGEPWTLVALYALLLWKTSTPSRSNTSSQSWSSRRRTSAAAAGSGATRSA